MAFVGLCCTDLFVTWNKYIAEFAHIKHDDSFAFSDNVWIMRFSYEMDKRKREEWVIIEWEQYITRSLSSSSKSCGTELWIHKRLLLNYIRVHIACYHFVLFLQCKNQINDCFR